MMYKQLIDPELKRLAKNIPFNRATIKLANLYNRVSLLMVKIPQNIASRTLSLKGYAGSSFQTTIFEPENTASPLPGLIYVHGGAFCYKASTYHKKLAYTYAAQANCRVFFPDYHLSPRFPFPAAYEDILALYKHITTHPKEFLIDDTHFGMAGDSAGATIAALICNNYEKEKIVCPCAQMLIYPALDADMQTESMKKFVDAPIWNSTSHRVAWSFYLPNATNKDLASPMHNALPTFIPDTYIETAEYDCLHDEGILYGKKLEDAGAQVELHETTGTFHGYDSAIKTKIVTENIKHRISFLNRCFQSC